MRQPSIALIFNPAARGEKARRFRESLNQMQDECTLLETTAPGSATSLAAQAIRDGYKTIVASGGDGTVNEVVSGLAKEREGLGQVQLGILPLGTMNVFARELGIPLSAKRAWKTVRHGQTRAVDLPLAKVQMDDGQAERCFVQMAGAGLDADAVGGVSIALKKKIGPLAYLFSTLTALKSKPPKLTAKWDGGSATGEWMCVGNGRFFGGPVVLFPDAKLNDGRLDLCVFPRINPGSVSRGVTSMVLGQIRDWPGAEHYRVSEFTIDGPAGTRVQADGDFIGTLPVTITLRPRALKVIVPSGK
ncbi:MAG: diacylglycerol kinase family lipid kinase [Verrucomicrobia bacterium]|nr:diacylglycerol kinase family lipid kinase [Verrucomicrobiota bacterium]